MVKTIKNKRNKRKSKKIIGGMEAGFAAASAFGSVFNRFKSQQKPKTPGQPPNPLQNPVSGFGFKEPNRSPQLPSFSHEKFLNSPNPASPDKLKDSNRVLDKWLNFGGGNIGAEYYSTNKHILNLHNRLNSMEAIIKPFFAGYNPQVPEGKTAANTLTPATTELETSENKSKTTNVKE